MWRRIPPALGFGSRETESILRKREDFRNRSFLDSTPFAWLDPVSGLANGQENRPTDYSKFDQDF